VTCCQDKNSVSDWRRSSPLSAGQYSWVRLDVDLDLSRSYIEVAGQRRELRCTSCDNNGLKLNRSFNVPADGAIAFTVDFDLRSSISDPQSGLHYNLRPTLRTVETALAGNISGTVDGTLITDLTGGPSAVYVYEGGGVTPNDIFRPDVGDPPVTWNNPVGTAPVEFDGSTYRYEAGYLPAGTYMAALNCDAQLDDPTMDDSGSVSFNGADIVPVPAGVNHTQGFYVTDPNHEHLGMEPATNGGFFVWVLTNGKSCLRIQPIDATHGLNRSAGVS
jgi:hypothetical protein